MTRSLHNCPAPAKLNLFLHVIGRRADGYHLLQSVFQLIDRCDQLHIDRRDDGVIRRSTNIPGVPADTDLIVRAARALQAATGTHYGADLALDKRLPMGGGLGGGSSDAATTLLVLNHLWQTGLNRAELMALGLSLGADVPFFLFGTNAFAEGVGETLQAVETDAAWFVVIEPGVAIPTAAIFTSPELTRNTKPVKMLDFSGALAKCEFGQNDLQAVATALYPPVAQAIEWLSQFGSARMTGSGACVFCSVASQAEAEAIRAQVPPRWTAWSAPALIQHPLAYLLPTV
ncbi:MAG: 4-(cytidine 5'-diphospho)-2-C-methyl-D-erythritol kinase [Pseudomonadota bacterium]|nr:4-(cytidine 5'-diphospho)-2-C-methyl-D-erythritol kinase [Pseudomonadota bacterium]